MACLSEEGADLHIGCGMFSMYGSPGSDRPALLNQRGPRRALGRIISVSECFCLFISGAAYSSIYREYRCTIVCTVRFTLEKKKRSVGSCCKFYCWNLMTLLWMDYFPIWKRNNAISGMNVNVCVLGRNKSFYKSKLLYRSWYALSFWTSFIIYVFTKFI